MGPVADGDRVRVSREALPAGLDATRRELKRASVFVRDGVIDSTTVLNPATGLPLKVEHYRLDRLVDAEVDTDRDGRLDTRWRYDPLGEVTVREPL